MIEIDPGYNYILRFSNIENIIVELLRLVSKTSPTETLSVTGESVKKLKGFKSDLRADAPPFVPRDTKN